MYLNGKDITFRGADNSLNVIRDNYYEILESLNWSQLCPQVNYSDVSDFLDPNVSSEVGNSNKSMKSDIPVELSEYLRDNDMIADLTLDVVNISKEGYSLTYNKTTKLYTLTIEDETYVSDDLQSLLKKI